tara:strand:+ start:288 stop:1670 length:1383 start_codon:yes stop_codon:yes gene_type:complete
MSSFSKKSVQQLHNQRQLLIYQQKLFQREKLSQKKRQLKIIKKKKENNKLYNDTCLKYYNFKFDNENKELKLKYFKNESFIISISEICEFNENEIILLLKIIKMLNDDGYDINLLILEYDNEQLKENKLDLNNYNFIKTIIINKKDIFNYFKITDMIIANDIFIKNIDIPKELSYISHKLFENYDKSSETKQYLIKGIILSLLTKRTIVAIIPVFGREKLFKYTIRRLYQKNKINHVIVLGESESERITAIKEGAIFIKHINKPLGAKWNTGFQYSKRFNPDAVLFVGSSDWISKDWIDSAYPYILNGYGYVGKKDYYMLDINDKNIRTCRWLGYLCNRKNETIGIGRLISKNLLEKINYTPFKKNKNSSMDYCMYQKCINNDFKIKILDNSSMFLSISCNLWANMHKFEYYYDGAQKKTNNDKEFLRNKITYLNTVLNSKDDYEKILKEFNEILEFQNE